MDAAQEAPAPEADADAGPIVLDPGVISASPASVSEHEPYVAASNGHVGVAWISRQSPNLVIGYRISIDDGETWGAIQSLPLPPNNNIAGDPYLAADDKGTLWIAWGSETKMSTRTNQHVFVAKAAPGAMSFGAPIEVTDPNEPNVGVYDQPKIAVVPAGLVVTYMFGNTDFSSLIIVAAYSPDGAQWTRTPVAGPGPSGSFRNRAALCDVKNSGQRTYMQYLDQLVGMALRWSDDGGKTWPSANVTAVQFPSETAKLSEEIGCAADGNDVWIFYGLTTDFGANGETIMPKRDALKLAHSPDRGASIDTRVVVSDKTAGKYFLLGSFARDEGGGFDVTYYAGNMSGDPAGSYRFSRSTDGTSFPSSVVRGPLLFDTSRTTLTWIGDYVGLAASGKNLHMAYADTSGSAAHIAYYRTSY